MMIKFFLFAIFSNIVLGQEDINISIDEPKLLRFDTFQNKICKNEPTCDLADLVPAELDNLRTRNCMCDADCATYGDCCLDSKYYVESEQKNNYKIYHCSSFEQIYMKVTCPSNYSNDTIKSKCEKSTFPLDSEDTKIIIPVTNIEKRITYGNEYCALCHGEKNYRSWNSDPQCYPSAEQSKKKDDFVQSYPLANFQSDTTGFNAEDNFKSIHYRVDNYPDLTENSTSTIPQNDLYFEAKQAIKFIKYDSINKKFFSNYKGYNFSCSYMRSYPKELEKYLRNCRHIIAECSNTEDVTVVEKCHSYTSIVIDNYAHYRNKECALCNGVVKDLPGCRPTVPAASAASTLFSTGDKGFGANPCALASLKEKFC